jgi:hypothetical protein
VHGLYISPGAAFRPEFSSSDPRFYICHPQLLTYFDIYISASSYDRISSTPYSISTQSAPSPAMSYNRPDASTAFTFDNDDRFVNQQPKGPDPLSANWSYDSAIDLFSLNTMLPETFPLDIPNDMLLDPKDFPVDLFAPPADISGFAISHSGEDSLSSVCFCITAVFTNY